MPSLPANADGSVDWGAASRALREQDTAEQVRNNLASALPINPDAEAQLRRAAQVAQVPLPAARAQPDLVKQQAQLSQFDAALLARQFPTTAKWLADPQNQNAPLAHDDVPALAQVEQKVQALAQPAPPPAAQQSATSRASGAGIWQTAGAVANYLFSANGVTNQESRGNTLAYDALAAIGSVGDKLGSTGALALSTLARGLDATGLTSHAQDAVMGWARMFDAEDEARSAPTAFHNKLVRSAASLGAQLPMMVATGGESALPQATQSVAQVLGAATQHGAKAMAIPALSDAVSTMKQVFAQTGDLGKAALAGEAQYAVSTAGGVVPLSSPGGLALRMFTGAGVGVVQGEVGRQAMNAVLPGSMAQPFDWENLALNAVTTSLMAGGMGPRAEPSRAAAVRAFNEAYEAARTDLQQQQLVGLAEAANASKLRERDPLAFQQLVAGMADRGDLPSIYIDATKLAEVLAQHGVTGDELHQTMPRVAEQLGALREDAPTNALVQIPVEDFATHIAGSPLEKPLMAEFRVNPDGHTAAEAEAFRQEQTQALTAQAKLLDQQYAADQAYQASLDAVKQDLHTRLQAIGMRLDMAEANAAPLAAFYQVHADRMGILPHEFAERYPVRFANKALEGFDQNYEGAPDSLMGFASGKPSKAFGEQRYKHVQYVEVKTPDGNTHVDAIAGLNSAHAMERARRNWEGSQVTALTEAEASARDASIVADVESAMKSGQSFHQESRGTFSPSTKTISVLKGADLSTFQHELGHYFLDTLAHLAAQPDAPASVKQDMATLLKHFGVEDLDTWHRMSVDEQRVHHEAFATGWETYLMKGEAPTLEMRSLFARFRAWMVSVYKSLKGAPGEFTPEVRAVFDRLIASEDAIHEAELARKYMPLFDSPEKSGMTPEQWAEYQALGKDATEQAIEKLTGKTLKDLAWMDKLRTASLKSVQKDAAEKAKAIKREVTAEVMSQPIYRAWAFLTGRDSGAPPDEVNAEHRQAVRMWQEKRDEFEAETKAKIRADAWAAADEYKAPAKNPGLAKGQWLAKNRARIDLEIQRAMLDYDQEHPKPPKPPGPDKQTGDPMGVGKLNTEALKAAAGAEVQKQLTALKMTSAKGLDPGIVADMFGFADGAELARALAAADHPREVIQGMVDQRMLERHGEIATPEALARTADALVQNEVRARFVASELRALKKATGSPRDIARAAKEAAQNTIDTKRIRDINERQFTAAETRSATQAEKALAKGDTAGAAIAKRDQLLNMELGRAAREAKDYVEKALAYLAKFDKPSVRENIALEYRDQIDALLDRADLRKSVSGAALDKRQSLLDFIEAHADYRPNIPEHLLNEAERWHYKDMPLMAFKGLVDSIKSIEHLGRLKETLRDGQETRRIAELADEVAASAARLPQRGEESNRGLTRMGAAWIKAKSFGRSVQASLLKMEQMFDWLDGRNPNGTLNRTVFRRFAEAQTREHDMQAVVKAEYDKLLASHLTDITKEKGKIYVAPGLIDGLTGKPQKFTKKELLMLAGNMGNESNAAKLAQGEKWDLAAVWSFLNDNMTKADWDFVAGVGRTLESLWPEKLAMDRRLGNTSPAKIEPRPFDTPHGRYDGWYWPLMYDPARAQDVAERGAKAGDQLFENTYSRANTDTGRMNTRNENYARPLLLDLDALPRMIRDEIHDMAWREAVLDADRFLSHPKVREAIVSALSQEHYDQIRPWLQSIANDGRTSTEASRGMKWMSQVANEARTRATMVGLGFRLTTAMVHGLSAGAESVSELGARWMASGLNDFRNPAQWAANRDFIFERSGEMRNRMNEVDRDIREHLREIDLHLMDPASSALSRGADLLRAHAYSMIGGLDMISALPTWMGAYNKGMTPVERGGQGMSEADAIYFADKTVRNAHGGTGVKDMARVQRGNEFQKLFTMFYTFWNHNVNRIVDTAKLVGSSEHRALMKEANHWSDSQLAATVIMRTLVYTIGVQVMHAALHPPPKDADKEHWLVWALKELGAAATAGIPIARDLYGHYVMGKDYKTTPAASVVEHIGKTGEDAAAALMGKQVSDKWLKHAITTAGVAANMPLGQPASTAQFLWDVGRGVQHPETAKDWWNGVLHGDMKSH